MISTAFKQQVISRLIELEKTSGQPSSRFATTLGLDSSRWSRLKKGEMDGILSDSRFITIAREQDIQMGSQSDWKTVNTATFEYITALLTTCHQQSISVLLVDMADIGKTHSAKHYARNNRDAVYMDCSQVKSKQLFVREIAKRFGVSNTGRYADVYRDLVYYINTLPNALIILDEAGDLKYDAFLELKALWNATEGNVGWFMMGADGLKAKLNRGIDNKKVGFTELFRRYGSSFRQVSPAGREQVEEFRSDQVALVAKANLPEGTDIQKLLKSSRGSLTNVRNMIQVMKQNMDRKQN
jgi:DNA transposition AAA+ family ATPase